MTLTQVFKIKLLYYPYYSLLFSSSLLFFFLVIPSFFSSSLPYFLLWYLFLFIIQLFLLFCFHQLNFTILFGFFYCSWLWLSPFSALLPWKTRSLLLHFLSFDKNHCHFLCNNLLTHIKNYSKLSLIKIKKIKN